jgi:carboxylesterase
MTADVSPFRFDGDRRGLLLVHGFCGTPFEMRPLGEALAARGFSVVGPALAGHAAEAARLVHTDWSDWYRSVERAFDELHARTDSVGVCGQSLGGLLALELARRRGAEVAAVATLAGALFIKPWMRDGIRRAAASRLLRHATIPKLFGSDIADRAMRRANPSRGMPIGALASLLDCMEHVRARLGEIDRPALVVHARMDHTIPFAAADELAARLAGPVERLTLERSHHVISLDVERAPLAAHLGGFFERQLRPPRSAAG